MRFRWRNKYRNSISLWD